MARIALTTTIQRAAAGLALSNCFPVFMTIIGVVEAKLQRMGELETALDTGLKERITSFTQLERLRVAGRIFDN